MAELILELKQRDQEEKWKLNIRTMLRKRFSEKTYVSDKDAMDLPQIKFRMQIVRLCRFQNRAA